MYINWLLKSTRLVLLVYHLWSKFHTFHDPLSSIFRLVRSPSVTTTRDRASHFLPSFPNTSQNPNIGATHPFIRSCQTLSTFSQAQHETFQKELPMSFGGLKGGSHPFKMCLKCILNPANFDRSSNSVSSLQSSNINYWTSLGARFFTAKCDPVSSLLDCGNIANIRCTCTM